ncbi:MAG: hypothetical protein AABZ30_08795 [Myxococcota bacterium]
MLALAACDSGSREDASDAGASPSDDASGGASLVVGTGEKTFVALDDVAGVPLIEGPQGGYHVWIALRAREIGPRVAVAYGLRDAQSGEELAIEGLSLPALDLADASGGAREFAGLRGFLSLFEAKAYVGRRVALWAIVTDDATGVTAEDEGETVVLDPIVEE